MLIERLDISTDLLLSNEKGDINWFLNKLWRDLQSHQNWRIWEKAEAKWMRNFIFFKQNFFSSQCAWGHLTEICWIGRLIWIELLDWIGLFIDLDFSLCLILPKKILLILFIWLTFIWKLISYVCFIEGSIYYFLRMFQANYSLRPT